MLRLQLAVVLACGLTIAPAAATPLARRADPVVVVGAALRALPDPDTAHLRVYRVRDGGLAPLPYQFDARDRHGHIELRRDEFRVDANDELVFMAADAGERAGATSLPAGCSAALEIAIDDPRAGGRAWVYARRRRLDHGDPAHPRALAALGHRSRHRRRSASRTVG